MRVIRPHHKHLPHELLLPPSVSLRTLLLLLLQLHSYLKRYDVLLGSATWLLVLSGVATTDHSLLLPVSDIHWLAIFLLIIVKLGLKL